MSGVCGHEGLRKGKFKERLWGLTGDGRGPHAGCTAPFFARSAGLRAHSGAQHGNGAGLLHAALALSCGGGRIMSLSIRFTHLSLCVNL